MSSSFVNRQTSGESASLPQYDEGTESAEVATSGSFVLNVCVKIYFEKDKCLNPICDTSCL